MRSTISFGIDLENKEKIIDIADKENKSVTQILEKVILKWLKRIKTYEIRTDKGVSQKVIPPRVQ